MPVRAIPHDMPFDDIEDEVFFTRAAVLADPDAEDLVWITDGWIPRLDGVRVSTRDVREAAMATNARRAVANARLDGVCTEFGDELFLSCGKDREAPRWRGFFHLPVSRFIAIGLAEQVQRIQGWLSEAKDAVLEKFREPLTFWSDRAAGALVEGRAIGLKRGAAWQSREEHAEALTADRDALYEALSARARERGLARDWPQAFFRKEKARRPSTAATFPGAGESAEAEA